MDRYDYETGEKEPQRPNQDDQEWSLLINPPMGPSCISHVKLVDTPHPCLRSGVDSSVSSPQGGQIHTGLCVCESGDHELGCGDT